MRFFLFIIFLFLFSCSNKVTQVYICGDHPCVNKKERKEYFDNNISIEVFTIISDKENKKKFTLVDLNLMKDVDNKDRKKSKNLSSVKSKEDVKKIIKKRRKLAKLKLKENLGFYAEGKYLDYWERPAYDIKVGYEEDIATDRKSVV